MDHAKQNGSGAANEIAAKKSVCIDCRQKGIAHQLPDMSGVSANSFDELRASAEVQPTRRSIRWISNRFTPLKAIKNRQFAACF